MSVTSHIRLANVHLHYPVVAYTHRSLVGMLAQLAGRRREISPLKSIHALKNISTEIRKG